MTTKGKFHAIRLGYTSNAGVRVTFPIHEAYFAKALETQMKYKHLSEYEALVYVFRKLVEIEAKYSGNEFHSITFEALDEYDFKIKIEE